MVQGAVPLLRHRVRRDGWRQGRKGRCNSRRHAGGGQSRAQLRQRLLPLQDHVRRRSADHAADAHKKRSLRQGWRVPARFVGPGLRRNGPAVEAGAEGERADRGRHVRLGPVDHVRGLCRDKAPNARHCMASAAVTFVRTFGMDEPMGCYDDFENADVFVLWGSNMAEMHPILWTRITDRRISAPHVRIHTLSTYEHRTTDLSDAALIFEPGTDLAVLNYVANHIIQTKAVNRDFVDRHVNFRVANTDIGYGLRPEHVLEQRALHANDAQVSQPSSFDAYAKMVSEYTLDRVADLSGVSKERLEALAKAYADPKTKVMSLWTMGFNQHVRGVWANHLVYNLHLLTGKIAEPGNSPFSLTGQPSACGTAREVGTFAHRLPADMQVTNPEHRAHAEHAWKLPEGTIVVKPGFHAVQQDR